MNISDSRATAVSNRVREQTVDPSPPPPPSNQQLTAPHQQIDFSHPASNNQASVNGFMTGAASHQQTPIDTQQNQQATQNNRQQPAVYCDSCHQPIYDKHYMWVDNR